jgi:hypothetical protein
MGRICPKFHSFKYVFTEGGRLKERGIKSWKVHQARLVAMIRRKKAWDPPSSMTASAIK